LKQLIINLFYLLLITTFVLLGIIISPVIFLISWLNNNEIKCKNCGLKQKKANWDYQKCSECNEYLFDDRW